MYFDYLILKIMKTLVRSLEVVTCATSLPKKIECEPECVINSCCYSCFGIHDTSSSIVCDAQLTES